MSCRSLDAMLKSLKFLVAGGLPLLAAPMLSAALPGALCLAQAAGLGGRSTLTWRPANSARRGLWPPARAASWRDRFLGRIAGAQADVGARRASLDTLRGISNDQIRSGALQSFAGTPLGGHGGAASADFESLIELITATVRPDTWEDVGGPGAIAEFPGGVYVDASGVLKKLAVDGSPRLSAVRRAAAADGGNREVHADAELRRVSLTRLEREVQLLAAQGLPPDEAMHHLAGLYDIHYLLVYPDTGDIVLAGPAGDWKTSGEGRVVNVRTGRPVLQLDDLVTLLRNAAAGDGTFTCSITPAKESLARTQAFLAESSKQPLRPGAAARNRWLKQLRQALGRQKIEFTGVDPRSRVAHVLLEADYHMKLVGMGLEEGTLGVESYLDSVKLAKGEAPPPMNVLRWWFTLNYDRLTASEGHDAFAFAGQGVKVLSENELLGARGERVHTGKSDELTARFARCFTEHFGKLSAKYPVYAELENIFDLALVAALLRAEDLPGQADWHMTHFGPNGEYEAALSAAPREVDTVINHRVVHGNQILAGVSGGVAFRPQHLLQPEKMQTGRPGCTNPAPQVRPAGRTRQSLVVGLGRVATNLGGSPLDGVHLRLWLFQGGSDAAPA